MSDVVPNMCDGCQRGNVPEADGLHRFGGSPWDNMYCTRKGYVMSTAVCPGHRLQSMTGSATTPNYCNHCKVWWGTVDAKDIRAAYLLPSEDDDGSATEIARLREEVARLQRERDEAVASDERTGEVLAAAHYEHIKRAAEVSHLTAERDALAVRVREVEQERDESRQWLFRVAVASMAGEPVTTDVRDQMTPQQVLDRVVDIAANRMWLLREGRTVTAAALRECAEECHYSDGWDECERKIRALLADLGLQVEGDQGKETP